RADHPCPGNPATPRAPRTSEVPRSKKPALLARGLGSRGCSLALAADPVAVAVEVVRVEVEDVPEDTEVLVRDFAAVQVGRRPRDADVRVRGRTVAARCRSCRSSRRRGTRRGRRQAAKSEYRV